jgi:hypothetical protein
MHDRTKFARHLISALPALILLFVGFAPRPLSAQSAEEIVRKVVGNELYDSDHDHSRWIYRDAYKSPTQDTVKLVVQTPAANLSELIEIDGHPPTAQEHQADLAHMQQVVDDPSLRARMRTNNQHDGQQARNLLTMLPNAFIWRIDSRGNGEIRLSYRPNPSFSPPTMSSRVLAAMAGTMTVDERQMRLKDLSGKLVHSVDFAWGLFGHIDAGGTFQVIHSEIAPHEWQITQTHVHISGHALFFKSIGDQEDEITSDYHPVPDGVDLQKAAYMLRNGEIARALHLDVHFG